MKQKRAKIGFTGCAKAYIRSLQEEGRYSTAHVYKNAVLSIYEISWQYVYCIRADHSRVFATLRTIPVRLQTETQYDLYLYANAALYLQSWCGSWYRPFYPPDCFVMYIPVWMSGRKKAIPVKELHTLLYKTPQSKSLAAYSGDCPTDVPVLRNAFCGFCAFGKVGIGTRGIEI